MPTVYEMEGNLIRRVERTVQEVGRLEDMLPSLLTYYPVEMGALPRDIVYIKVVPSPRDSTHVEARIIVQQPPQVRQVLFNESGGPNETQQAYRLAMPYFNFWFNMNGSPIRTQGEPSSFIWAPRSWGIFWTNRPFESTERTEGFPARMPNSWGDTRVCFGVNPITANITLGAHINQLINVYWGSVFNTDLEVNTPYGRRPRTALDRWQAASEADHDVWRHWDLWQAGGEPIKTMVERVAGQDTFMQPAPDSTEPLVPQPPVQRTWYSITTWVRDNLTEEQRTRLLSVLQEVAAT